MESLLLQKDDEKLRLSEYTLESLPYEDEIIRKVILKIKEQNLLPIKENTLGVLFEKLMQEEERKDLGQFYTPQEIVNYIINFLRVKPKSKILDPTCGCGVFLVSAYNYLRKFNPNAINNIYGVDLNESATKITRINLWLRNGKNLKSLKILERNIKIGNSIVKNDEISDRAFDWNREFFQLINEGGFDFIIGNPPYVTLKNGRDYDITESFFSKIANGNTNAASLVVTKSFELLKEGGIMAFVLPKTLIRVNSYSKLRQFLINNSKILHIFDLGSYFNDVRGEQIILFIQKAKNEGEIKKNNVLIKIFENKQKALYEQKEFYVPQILFKKYNSFLMFEDKGIYNLIEKIGGIQLEEIAEIFRGLAISPSSHLIIKSKEKESTPIIKGKNISKFSYSNNYFVNINKINTNSMKLKQFREERIILQNIFSSEAGIISCIDGKGNLNFDTVTNILLKNDNFDIKYILGLLNSKLINFYLIYAVYNKSKLTMHADKVYIGKIPIKKISKIQQKGIVKIVKKVERAKEKNKLLRRLDKKIYKIYGIKKNEQNLIEDSLRQIMSQKSLW